MLFNAVYEVLSSSHVIGNVNQVVKKMQKCIQEG